MSILELPQPVERRGRRFSMVFLEQLINEKKKKFGVKRVISKRTIISRIFCGRIKSTHSGVKSPLEEAEAALIAICIQMGKISQPLNCTEAVKSMNDLIEGTATQQALIEFQTSWKIGGDNFQNGKVMAGWWRGFLKRNAHKIVTKWGEMFVLNCHDWMTCLMSP